MTAAGSPSAGLARPSKGLDAALWVVPGLLALSFAGGGIWKLATVLAAVGCVALMASAIVFHVSRGEAGKTPFNFLLLALSVFVAWGGWLEGAGSTARVGSAQKKPGVYAGFSRGSLGRDRAPVPLERPSLRVVASTALMTKAAHRWPAITSVG